MVDQSDSHKQVDRRRVLGMLASGGMLVSFAGCAGGGGEGPATSTDTETTATGGTATETQTPSRQRGSETFRAAIGSEPSTLDIHKASRRPEAIVLSAINEPLFLINEKKEPVPHLVSEYSRNDDATEFTFTLEKGITLHDGAELTADLAKWNLNRFLQNSPYASRLGKVQAIEATSDYEFTMAYDNAYPLLPRYLSYWNVGMTSRTAVEEAGKDYGISTVVGTGAYQFDKWERGARIQTTRFEDYDHGPSWLSNPGPGFVGSWSFEIIPESTTLLQEVISGDIHGSVYIPLTDTGQVESAENASLQRLQYTRPGFHCINCVKEPTSDLRVRKAIVHAIDKQAVIDAAVGGEGYPIWNLVPPLAVNAIGEERAKKLGQPYNLEKARSLLDEAGWTNSKQGEVRTKDGEELNLTFLAFTISRYATMGKVTQAMLKKVGIKTDLNVLEAGTLYKQLGEAKHHIVTMAAGGNFASDAIEPLLLSKNDVRDGGTNFSIWLNEQFDKYLNRAQTHPDAETRHQAAINAQELVLKEAPVAPIMGFNKVFGHKNAVKGIEQWKEHPWWPDRHYIKRLELDL